MIYQQLIQNNIYQIKELNPYHVLQSMQRLQIRSITQKRKTKIKPGEYCEAFQDLVQGDFIPQEPNKVWYTDFTYVKAKGSSKACLDLGHPQTMQLWNHLWENSKPKE